MFKYTFDVRINASHFDAARKFFDSLNKNIEEFTGEKHTIGATVSLGTFSATSPKELSFSDRAKIIRVSQKTFRKMTKNKDITVVEAKDSPQIG